VKLNHQLHLFQHLCSFVDYVTTRSRADQRRVVELRGNNAARCCPDIYTAFAEPLSVSKIVNVMFRILAFAEPSGMSNILRALSSRTVL
jgi:hypothetical protein